MHKPLPLDALTAADVLFRQHVLHRDYETRSQAILKVVGASRYSLDPSTEVLCACYAVDDGPVKLWRPGDPVPLAAQNRNWIVTAFNDTFEAAIEKDILAPRYSWPVVPIDRHQCTQAMCLALGLPARLSAVADALELLTPAPKTWLKTVFGLHRRFAAWPGEKSRTSLASPYRAYPHFSLGLALVSRLVRAE